MNKINIFTFVIKYDKTAEEDRAKFIKDNLEIVPYIPYKLKLAYAKNIVKISSWDESGKRLVISSSTRYMLFINTILKEYTNLEFDESSEASDISDVYDALNSRGLIDVIFELIPETELNEFKSMIDDELDDLMTNTYEMNAFISNKIDVISKVIEKSISPLLDKLSDKIEKLDKKDIEKIIKVIK